MAIPRRTSRDFVDRPRAGRRIPLFCRARARACAVRTRCGRRRTGACRDGNHFGSAHGRETPVAVLDRLRGRGVGGGSIRDLPRRRSSRTRRRLARRGDAECRVCIRGGRPRFARIRRNGDALLGNDCAGAFCCDSTRHRGSSSCLGNVIPWPAWAGFWYACVISMFLGSVAWYRGLAAGGIARIGQLNLAQPLLALLWSAILLGERITWPFVVTAIVVIAAMAVCIKSRVASIAPARHMRPATG